MSFRLAVLTSGLRLASPNGFVLRRPEVDIFIKTKELHGGPADTSPDSLTRRVIKTLRRKPCLGKAGQGNGQRKCGNILLIYPAGVYNTYIYIYIIYCVCTNCNIWTRTDRYIGWSKYKRNKYCLYAKVLARYKYHHLLHAEPSRRHTWDWRSPWAQDICAKTYMHACISMKSMLKFYKLW